MSEDIDSRHTGPDDERITDEEAVSLLVEDGKLSLFQLPGDQAGKHILGLIKKEGLENNEKAAARLVQLLDNEITLYSESSSAEALKSDDWKVRFVQKFRDFFAINRIPYEWLDEATKAIPKDMLNPAHGILQTLLETYINISVMTANPMGGMSAQPEPGAVEKTRAILHAVEKVLGEREEDK